ncbi:C39 family peptidase [Patescibacteria group bacterium]
MAGPEDLKSIGGEGLKKPPEPKGSVKGPKEPEKKDAKGEGLGTPDKDQARKDVPAPKKTPGEETPEAKPEEAKTTAPRIPGGESEGEEEDKEHRSPMGENPLEGAGKAAKAAGDVTEKAGKGIEKAGGLAATALDTTGVAAPVGETVRAGTKIAGKAAQIGGKVAKKGGEEAEKKGREAAKEGEIDEDEEDAETAAKIAAEKGKKKISWLKWPAIIGGVGCVGCGCIAALIGLVIMIIVVVTGGGGDFGAGVRDMLGLGDGIYLNQGDSPWGSKTYCGVGGESVTIGSGGCTVTTGAMALRAIGIDTDPEKLSQLLCSKKDSWGYGGEGQGIAAQHYNVKLVTVNSAKGLEEAITAGHMVGIYANPANSLSAHSKRQGEPHSVLVVGIDGDTLTIMDPSDPNGVGKSYEEPVTRTCSLSDWVNATHWGYYYTK